MYRLFQESRSIKWVYQERKNIDFSPPCQRRGNLWTKQQKQLLIDSILNEFDVPKFYFQFMPSDKYAYAIIDGKQRIETILDFLDDKFPLSTDFKFIDKTISLKYPDIAGKKCSEIDEMASALLARVWQYSINIVFIDSDNEAIINEMFVRLNSGLQVSTIEKRNANGGLLSREIMHICDNSLFFTKKITLGNHRFEHNDLLLKLLMLEMGDYNLTKTNVDQFVFSNKEFKKECKESLNRVEEKLDKIAGCFDDKDKYLKRKNIIITLYTILDDIDIEIIKDFLVFFETIRREATDDDNSQELSEFTRLLQQGADKKASILRRRDIMSRYWRMYRTDITK